ncbi:MAG: murein biosynthesis integral membrane protein MurJ [Pelagibacteraceae bacterium]|jgi:putative peptidoglycan lipid II flippase
MNILTSVSSFGILTLVSRILGYLRDILIAFFVGTSFLADAFFVAFRLPNTFRRLFAEGSFNSAFVPQYSKLDVKKKSYNFANSIFNLLVFSLLLLICVAEIFMGGVLYLISPGFLADDQKFELATSLSRITFPFLFFVSLSSFYSGILNSKGKFAVAASAPIILNVMLIGSIYYSYINKEEYVYHMSWAVSIAGFLQLLMLYFYSKKYFVPKLSFNFTISEEVKYFFRRLLPSIFSSGIMQINILVGTIIASFQASAVSYLYYADRIYQLPLAITGIAIATVILPTLSKAIFRKEEKSFFLQNRSIELSLFLSAPAMVGILVATQPIISCLFGYGSFNQESIYQTSRALFIFGFGLPAFSLLKIYSSFYFARGDTKFPFKVSLLTVIINILISILFFAYIGFIAIALGTVISCWIAILVYQVNLHQNNLHQFDKIFKIRISKIFVCSFIMSAILYFLLFEFGDVFYENSASKIFYLVGIVGSSALIYFLLSILFKSFSISDFKSKSYETR